MWLLEKIGLVIELIVLVAILRELRALRKHERALEQHQEKVAAELEELGKMQAALQQHEEQIISEVKELRNMSTALEKHEKQLDEARPIFSTLYTEPAEIMGLSISFTEEAKEIYALGSIGSLLDTEIWPKETQLEFEERRKTVSAEARRFVAATENSILGGCKYRRAMNFKPADSSERTRLEILTNLSFFRRILNASGTHDLDLQLYHSDDIVPGSSDYHFRCNDFRVDLRIGGHGNEADAAISITDARVVEQYRRYYESLLRSDSTRLMTFDNVIAVYDLLVESDFDGLAEYLANLPQPPGIAGMTT